VPDQNLIGVDLDRTNVDSLRTARVPTLNGDIETVVASWPVDRPVCAVLLDFCAGFTQPAVDIYDLLERKPFRQAVIAVNLQRGRDPYSNDIRRAYAGKGDDDFPWMRAIATLGYGPSNGPADGLPDTHRALQWLTYHAADAAHVGVQTILDKIRALQGYEAGYEDFFWLMNAGAYFQHAKPKFYSYPSGVLTFDSVVITNPSRRIDESIAAEQADADVVDAAIEAQHASQRCPEMARKIAAMLAVRTKRLAS